MARWTVRAIAEVPIVADGDPDDPVWYPLQRALGIDTFGVNLFVASGAGQTIVEEHDERASGQQELYLVLEGEAIFELDGEIARLDRGTALAITEPSVRRSARAVSPGTSLLIVGAGGAPFTSTWNPSHFTDIPHPD
jgi:quercetin dioxygenase-like cupin family protein